MDFLDREILLKTQGGLPLVSKPFDEVARTIGCSPEMVRERFQKMLEMGVVRRIAAIPNHYQLGYRLNGMSVWDLPDEMVDELGVRVGSLDFVTHCYRRPRFLPDWPYNLFAMVHARSREELDGQLLKIQEILEGNCRAWDVLFSKRILKKTGLRMAEKRCFD